VLPLLLIASQYASQKLVTPQTDDPAQKQTQAVLGFLPFMIGEATAVTPWLAAGIYVLAYAHAVTQHCVWEEKRIVGSSIHWSHAARLVARPVSLRVFSNPLPAHIMPVLLLLLLLLLLL
jgi:hypothetical protein